MRTLEVDFEELKAAGTAMVTTGDDVGASARRGVLLAEGHYGVREMDDAAGRFAARFTHLVEGIGEEIASVGMRMRGSADGYAEFDALMGRNLDQVMPY